MSDARRVAVLVAERDPRLAETLAQFLTRRGCEVTACGEASAALGALRAEAFDVALLDLGMPALDGMAVLRAVREDALPPEVIILTGDATIESAVAAMTLGAYAYLTRPYRLAEIEVLVHRAWEKRRLAREHATLSARVARLEGAHELVTAYAPLQAVLALAARAALTDAPVLIAGESGTGKELVARMLHRASPRAGGPWAEVDGGAVPAARLEIELFGREADAARGGARTLGVIELASGGTAFVDHVEALDARAQEKLRRVLEDGVFTRVGGAQKVRADARLIVATDRDLEAMAVEGAFRADLLERLGAVHVLLPPLRERSVDIPLLARRFLGRAAGDGPPRTLSADALDALQSYAWPGNVTELRHVIERAALATTAAEIDAADLLLGRPALAARARAVAEPPASLGEVERRQIEAVLRHVDWHQRRAAEILGISAKTLYRKMREHGFHRPRRTRTRERA